MRQDIDDIRRVNLIIGRNNAGKSSLLDIIEHVCNRSYEYDSVTWRAEQEPQIQFCSKITDDVVNRTFPANTTGGRIAGNHANYGRHFINREVMWTKRRDRQADLIACNDEGIKPTLLNSGGYAQTLVSNLPIPIEGKLFRRVLAERDIVPESDGNGNIRIEPNGEGITNAIQSFINRSNFPSELVERHMLSALNEIFAHDACFTDIVCQLYSNNYWEIFLEEENKGRIALSKSGSGLKTVINVLVCLFLIPKLDNQPLENYVFGFEELENNIHPALLRRLNDYIYRTSVDNGFIYFITTHSNVLIDQFSRQEDAQIIHVTQANAEAKSTTVRTYVENNGILDDLDVRASDLLQANGIIWVEGPSDRIYLNRWIELWSNGNLKEGTHYQIIFYGGRLLSHLSAEEPEMVNDGISILNANRNAVMVIDSDKRNNEAEINSTKQRINDEFEARNSLCWITQGKEIENYIPVSVVNEFLGLDSKKKVNQYDSFFDFLDGLVEGEGKRYLTKKSLLAEKLIPYMNIDNMGDVLDLNEKLTQVCEAIEHWNS